MTTKEEIDALSAEITEYHTKHDTEISRKRAELNALTGPLSKLSISMDKLVEKLQAECTHSEHVTEKNRGIRKCEDCGFTEHGSYWEDDYNYTPNGYTFKILTETTREKEEKLRRAELIRRSDRASKIANEAYRKALNGEL